VPFMPVHSDQPITHISAPYLTWGTILFCVVVQIWMSGLPVEAEWRAAYSFGFIPGEMMVGLQRPPAIDVLPAEFTLLTYQFFHGGVGHLIGNMLVLFVFGGVVEDRFGHVRFGLLYLGAGVIAGLAHGMQFPESTTVLVGASGAIAGVLGAYIVMFPRARVTLLGPLFIPLRLRAWLLIGIWFLIDLFMAGYGGDSNVAWSAHVAGFMVGVLAGLMGRRLERFRI